MNPRTFTKAIVKALADQENHVSVMEHINKIVISQRPYTFVQLTMETEQGTFVGRGFSKVCYPDTWNEATGAEIATAKAVQNLAKSYLS